MKTKILLLILFFCKSVFTQTISVKADIDLLLQDPFFKRSQIAIDIYDLTAKEILYRHNEKLLMHPASNMKILTSAAALYFLGPTYKFETSIWYDGEIDDSVLTGNIYFVGGFDPDFTSDDLDSLAREISIIGIKKINGNIFGDVSMMDSLYWGNGWMWDDDPYTDFPYMTPLIINDAAVQVEYSLGNIGDPIKLNLYPKSNFFEVQNSTVTTSEENSNFEITRDWLNNNNTIIAHGYLNKENKTDTINLNLINTTQYFLTLAKESFIKNGIRISGDIGIAPKPPSANKLTNFFRTYEEVIVNLNKESDNLSAEMTLRAMANEFFEGSASAEKGIKLIDSLVTLVGFNPIDYRFVDGSGVSHYNLVSAELLNDLLKYFYYEHPNLFNILKKSFPVAGVDGTLKSRMENSEAFNKVNAKTGTLSGVSSLSGYVKAKNEHDISFSILMQNFVGSSKAVRNIQDSICTILAKYD